MNGIKRILVMGCTLILLAGCTRMVGSYRGPEPFGGKEYLVAPPSVRIAKGTKIVVLLLKDERPKNERELDWVRQSNPMGDTRGQPMEVRKEFDRAIKSGLTAHPGISLVAPEVFAETRDADLVISGRIVRCDAEKKIGWTTADFYGHVVIELLMRDGRGKALWPKPVQFAATAKKQFAGSRPDFMVDEIPPGLAAGVVEEAIRRAVEDFLASKDFAASLKSVKAAY